MKKGNRPALTLERDAGVRRIVGSINPEELKGMGGQPPQPVPVGILPNNQGGIKVHIAEVTFHDLNAMYAFRMCCIFDKGYYGLASLFNWSSRLNNNRSEIFFGHKR